MARGRGKLTPQDLEYMKIISKNINKLLDSKGYKQIDLSKGTGIPPSTLTGYVKGTSIPIPGNVQKIADFFNVAKSDIDPRFGKPTTTSTLSLINERASQLNPDRQLKVLDYTQVQLDEQKNISNIYHIDEHLKSYSSVAESSIQYRYNEPYTSIIRGRQSAAGQMIEVDDNQAEQDVLPSSMVPRGANELVEITGSSMEPLIAKGSEVYIRYQEVVENGEIAIVRVDGEGVTCKRFYFDGTTVTLKSENEDKEKYPDMHFSPEEVSVLGKVLV